MVPTIERPTTIEFCDDIEEAHQLSNEEVERQFLAWFNMLRTEYGQEPLNSLPKGTQKQAAACPGAKALNGISDGSCMLPSSYGRFVYSEKKPPAVAVPDNETVVVRFARDGKTQTIFPPKVVGEFVHRFDRGEMPHLVQE